ncbi:DUF4249 family protein [Emticicia sp. CRIBPO]|uniref:DUF4249 domain-containing protein n=1 Tax=Emticicia sp. CRIBPO TaxID=2683258 RepID=UPI0014127668|nr:DUF4249 domain-containing protein [Emticicia sp. CRIBPO]NBA89040.1 DUF4249 family protein [Emticicia sp. CRIBPO]
MKKQTKITRIISFFLLSSFMFFACVDTFQVDISTSKGYLIVDGTITDLNEPQLVYIGRIKPDVDFKSSDYTSVIRTNSEISLPESRVEANVIVNGTKSYRLTETEPGYYRLPPDFKAKAGDDYQLKFKTYDGISYESTAEKMMPVPAIKNLREEFNPVGIKKVSAYGNNFPTNDFYLDFEDPSGDKNFYRWKWTSWEVQKICASCPRGKYYLYEGEEGVTGDCFRDLTINSNITYDYNCGSDCWDIFTGSDINIMSDIYSNGQEQKNKLAAQVPLYQYNPALVSVQQTSLTANAYRYFKLIQDQAVNTGTLADTPPAPIKSNVTNIARESELVLGFFSASSVSEVRVMLSRTNTKGSELNSLFRIVTNRDANIEQVSQERPYIPLAVCKNSRLRTPFVPAGWRYGRD